MGEQPLGEYVLGIDLGTNSLGWAIVGLVDGEPAKLVRAGARVFEAGVNIDPKSGRESTLNTQRRDARLHRRQLWRHRRRLVKLAHILQRCTLLPEGDVSDPQSRQDFINRLDAEILASDWFASKEKSGLYSEPKQVLPYILRAAALDEKLEPHFLGRAIYHLAQRRGFWSNKKTAPKKDEKPGKVAQDIKTLRSEMGGRHLGQYFASLSPLERRIRDQYTSRDMYQAEFKAIWDQQAKHQPDLLKPEWRSVLYDAVFEQRPLKLKRGLVGACEFEPGERRAPAHLLISQQFRLLQVVNNLKVRVRGGEYEALGPDSRKELITALERCPSMEFKEVRELLGLGRGNSINLQRDKEEARMPGNDTGAQFIAVFGQRWLEFSATEQDRIVADAHSILSIRDFDTRRERAKRYLAKRGVENVDTACEKFLDIKFEAGYMSLSVSAMQRFMPLLERGFRYGALSPHYRYLGEVKDELIQLVDAGISPDKACERVLTRKAEHIAPLDSLPPVLSEEVQKRIGAVRNPIVTRSITELRKVVNAVIERFGKPTQIHVELLRELRKPKKEREKIWAENLSREKRNRNDEAKINDINHDIARVTPRDVEKYRLWQESEFCPYCGKAMTPRLLFGDDSEYQIDHIIPFSRWPDDAFVNKVLCHTGCNRRKGQRTPFEAFGESPEGYDYKPMLDRVKSFRTDKDTREEKLRRFKLDHKGLQEFLSKRPAQQLNDSAYASRLAADYLGLLYGGRTDEDGNLRVQARVGGLTRYFREAWDLNSILGDGDSDHGGKKLKPRHDHRHHAIDAAVIAVTDQQMFTRLSNAAKRGWVDAPGRFGDFKGPRRDWDFRQELKREVLHNVVVSHRVSKKVSGALHEETIYSRPFPVAAVSDRRPRSRKNGGEDTAATAVRVRKPLASLTKPELEQIADEGVKKLVLKKLEELGGGEPKKAFSNQANLPKFPQSGVLIKRVRINKATPIFVLGEGRSARHVTSESNHHIEIFAELDTDGSEVEWDGEVVPMQEAYRRMKAREPVVKKNLRPGRRFKFSLAQGEAIECDGSKSTRRLLVTRSYTQLSAGSIVIGFAPASDARPKKEMQADKSWVWKGPDTLRKLNPRKVVVSPLGEISDARD